MRRGATRGAGPGPGHFIVVRSWRVGKLILLDNEDRLTAYSGMANATYTVDGLRAACPHPSFRPALMRAAARLAEEIARRAAHISPDAGASEAHCAKTEPANRNVATD